MANETMVPNTEKILSMEAGVLSLVVNSAVGQAERRMFVILCLYVGHDYHQFDRGLDATAFRVCMLSLSPDEPLGGEFIDALAVTLQAHCESRVSKF